MATILGQARLALLAGMLALAGCVTTENSLSQNDIASMKLTDVSVSFIPDPGIQWEDGIRAYATSKSIPDDQIAAAANTAEAKAYVQSLLAARIKAGVEKAMAGQLNGTRPVRLVIVVHNFVISPAIQRAVIGGGHGMMADATLVDARTGARVLSHPKLSASLIVGQGVLGTAVQAAIDSASTQSTLDKIVDRYGESYRDWLLRKTS
jgi:type II secretory pathway component GspD/PulD (secretin)